MLKSSIIASRVLVLLRTVGRRKASEIFITGFLIFPAGAAPGGWARVGLWLLIMDIL